MHPKLGRNPRAGEKAPTSVQSTRTALKSSCFLHGYIYIFFFSFFSFFFFFHPRLSPLSGFANLERNCFSPDCLDPMSGPSWASRPPYRHRGLAPGRGLSPRLIYLGRATPLFAIQIHPEHCSQLGRGRGLGCQTGRVFGDPVLRRFRRSGETRQGPSSRCTSTPANSRSFYYPVTNWLLRRCFIKKKNAFLT